mgnify:CR=1 FL=1
MWRKGIRLIGGYVNAKPHALTQTSMDMRGTWPPTARTAGKHYGGAGAWTSEADTLAFLELLRYRRIDVQRLITHRFAPQDAAAAFGNLVGGDAGMLGGLFTWKK